jgi:hypothetical protein
MKADLEELTRIAKKDALLYIPEELAKLGPQFFWIMDTPK